MCFCQYLESCGLTETYTTFYDECKSSGMLIPSHYKAEIERGISLQDVETLLMHFDQENGGALLEVQFDGLRFTVFEFAM